MVEREIKNIDGLILRHQKYYNDYNDQNSVIVRAGENASESDSGRGEDSGLYRLVGMFKNKTNLRSTYTDCFGLQG